MCDSRRNLGRMRKLLKIAVGLALFGITFAQWVGKASDVAQAPDRIRELGKMWFFQTLADPLVAIGLMLTTLWAAYFVWSEGLVASLRVWYSGVTSSDPQGATALKPARSSEPFDLDARSALFLAATGQTEAPPDAATGKFVGAIYDALHHFYDLASTDGLRVWGRPSHSRPLKLVERSHWQDWEIKVGDLFGKEPIRTVPRGRLPDNSSPYYDIRLNRAEVEAAWPHSTKSAPPVRMPLQIARDARAVAARVRSELLNYERSPRIAKISESIRDEAYKVLARMDGLQDTSLRATMEKLAMAAHQYIWVASDKDATAGDFHRISGDTHTAAQEIIRSTSWVEEQ